MKRIMFVVLSLLQLFFAQAQKINWQNMDLARDTVMGMSTEKAYKELLKNKKSKKVIVAIIDTGVDTLHEDLRSVLWTNPENGAHGWNYIGTETGQEDVTKLVGSKKDFFDSLSYTLVPEQYRAGYQFYREVAPALRFKIRAMQDLVEEVKVSKKVIDTILTKTGKKELSSEDIRNYSPETELQKRVVKQLIDRFAIYKTWKDLYFNEVEDRINLAAFHLAHGLNMDNIEKDTAQGDLDLSVDPTGIVSRESPAAYHSTHVCGILGAVRNNGIGLDGVADNVQLMILKANGNIRELRDKSLAKAIRFATDHGAKVINISMGKSYSLEKNLVDEAVKHAMQKDVLIVHAAGNDGQDLDRNNNYPCKRYADSSGEAQAWIEVGASGPKDDNTLAAEFSNYGKTTVDVFAPGVKIYSTVPYSKYENWSGTSMAAPMVAGLAAVIREYYPKLTAIQVKQILMQSVVKREVLKDKCVAGGVVNAFNSIKLAANK